MAGGSGAGNFWKTTGNSGTNPSTNFIGTTDGADLIIQPSSGNVGIGTTSPLGKLQVEGCAYFNYEGLSGYGSLYFVPMANEGSSFIIGTGGVSLIDTFSGGIYSIDMNSSVGGIKVNSFDTANNINTVSEITQSHARIFSDVNSGGFFLNSANNFIGIGTVVPDTTLHIEGSVKIVDGTEGLGKVLTSDAGGLASWGVTRFTPSDSATIYATTPAAGTTYTCTDCSGTGVTGRIVYYMDSAWRRVPISLLIP